MMITSLIEKETTRWIYGTRVPNCAATTCSNLVGYNRLCPRITTTGCVTRCRRVRIVEYVVARIISRGGPGLRVARAIRVLVA